MKKAVIFAYAFILFSCSSRKEGVSIYLTSDLSSLFWEHDESVYSLREKISSDPNPKITIEIGDFFSPKHPENILDSWDASIKAASIFGVDAISANKFFFDIKNSKLPADHLSIVLSSNAYLKNRKKFSPTRLYCKNGKTKICVMSVYIQDLLNPEKHTYIKEYRLENPLYEINRNMKESKAEEAFSILIINLNAFDRDKDRKALSNLIERMPIKPVLIIIDAPQYFKSFKEKNVSIASARFKSAALRILIYEIPVIRLKKLVMTEINPNKKSSESSIIPELEKIRTTKEKQMSKKYSTALRDLKRKDGKLSPLAKLMSKILSAYIRSNGAFYSKDALNTDIKKGDITLKDIYKAIPIDDRLIYCKIKGQDLEKMIKYSYTSNMEYYPFEINEQKEINIAGKPLKKDKLYRILTHQSGIDKDYSILAYSMEFSVLPRSTIDAALWYFRTHKKVE